MPKTHPSHHKKRVGLHHKRTKRYHHVYLPYLPAMLLIVASFVLSGFRPGIGSTNVLAYATEMSSSSLLSSTNQYRASNGASSLTLNTKLSQAAQAKANDMVNRDYWSHNTPDGQEPWIFFDQTGYDYQKAGENLAYGFATSTQTVAGWMNSATHRANMLDGSFTEVGFGFTNAENYQSSGNQTVVVAMYAKPQVAAAAAPVEQSTPAPAPKPSTKSASPVQSRPAETPNSPAAEPETQPVPEQALQDSNDTVAEAPKQILEESSAEKQITRAQALTGGQLPWATFAAGLIGGTGATVLFINHGLRLRKLFREGRRFVLHHPALDVTMISFIVFSVVLSQHVGTIL